MTYTLKGFGPLVSLLPYQFGFVPTNSFIVVFFDGAVMEACIRMDVGDVNDECAQVLTGFIETANSRHITSAAIVMYDAADHYRAHHVQQALGALGITVHHHVVVEQGRWRTQMCTQGCCDQRWRAVDAPATVAPVAETVIRGVAP